MQAIKSLLVSIVAKKKQRKISNEGKMLYLESMRGLAALTVLCAHILITYFPSITISPSYAEGSGRAFLIALFSGFPLGFTNSGHFAVVLFFTLSGFVLTYKYFQTHNIYELQKQAAKRYFRLAIPIFSIVMVAWAMVSVGMFSNAATVTSITGSPETARIFSFTSNLWSALSDATFGTLLKGSAEYNPVLWTMTIEFIGSFLLFGFIAIVGKLRYRWVGYACSIIMLNFSYYTCFIIGAILADIATNTAFIQKIREKVSTMYAYLGVLSVILLASLPYPNPGYAERSFRIIVPPSIDSGLSFQAWHFIAAALLLLIILAREEIQAAMSGRFLVFIGSISFSLYLTHYLILHSIGDAIFVSLVNDIGITYSALVAALVVVIVTLIVSIFWKKYIDDMSVRVSRAAAKVLLKV